MYKEGDQDWNRLETSSTSLQPLKGSARSFDWRADAADSDRLRRDWLAGRIFLPGDSLLVTRDF